VTNPIQNTSKDRDRFLIWWEATGGGNTTLRAISEQAFICGARLERNECIKICTELTVGVGEMKKKCTWQQDVDNNYETDCGNLYSINDGTPVENSMKYCTYCGGQIIQGLLLLECAIDVDGE